MIKQLYKVIFFTLLVLISLQVVAQPGGRQGMDERGEESDNDKKKKDVKPEIHLWNVSGYAAFLDSTKLDTLHDYNHIYHPVFKKAWTAAYVGNYGNAALDNNFFNREPQMNYFFAESREAYFLTPSRLNYFNTHTPYTRLDYTQSENKSSNTETRFDVIHSQNINPWWNFTFKVNLAKSDGQYNSQDAKNNSLALYSSYNKDFWNIHAGFITNSIENYENGGLTNDSLIFDSDDAEYWDVNLVNSVTNLSSNYFFANGEYRFGKFIETEDEGEDEFRPVMGLIYSFEYNMNKHEFTEEETDDNTYFDTTYYSDDYTKDSIRFNRLSNLVQLKQYENADKKFSFGKRAFLGHELNSGSMPGVQENDTTLIRRDIKYSNVFAGGGIFRETGNFWKWNFDGKIYLTGRHSGQTELNGLIYKPVKFWRDSLASITFTGKIENRVPDYFQEKFYSNHIKWNQGLDMEQRMTAGGSFKSPKRKLEIGAKYSIINNYIYNDTLGVPAQADKELLVLSAYVDNDFNFRRLHFRTRLLWQKVSEEKYLHLPEWSAFISAYYQFTISKVMFAQVGSDVRYNTKYYADAYSPSTGLFYLQDDKEYGDFPYIDVYANLRLKRTRVFFKLINVGSNFINKEYMTTPHYPMNRSTFRLGVSWAFYD